MPKKIRVPRVKPVSQEEPEGNTKTSGGYQAYNWCFTLKKSLVESPSQVSQMLAPYCKKWRFQEEIGKETGYEHYQGVLSLIVKERMTTLKNILPYQVRLSSCKSWFGAWNYAGKVDTRVAGPWDHTSSWVKDPIVSPSEWMLVMELELKKEADRRTIWWLWEPNGGVGKSSWVNSMYLRNKDVFILEPCKSTDIMHLLSEHIKKNNAPRAILVDVPRSAEEFIGSLYGTLERIKNGRCISGKYEGGIHIFNPPHIVVLANFEPETKKMSEDRWMIRRL